jgi:hypothetical protein
MSIVRVLRLLGFLLASFGADNGVVPLRGKLKQDGGVPSIGAVKLEGDEPTMKVLTDERLNGVDVEVMGRPAGTGRFAVNHTHTKPVFMYRDGKRLQVTYWCDVCYIRTYSPGKCWCCQKNTDLDPIEPEP